MAQRDEVLEPPGGALESEPPAVIPQDLGKLVRAAPVEPRDHLRLAIGDHRVRMRKDLRDSAQSGGREFIFLLESGEASASGGLTIIIIEGDIFATQPN